LIHFLFDLSVAEIELDLFDIIDYSQYILTI
jgi:hypothetical protein